jgi:hypothetical protein
MVTEVSEKHATPIIYPNTGSRLFLQNVDNHHHTPSPSPSFLLLSLWRTGHPWNGLFHISFLILRQSVGLLGRGISPSQGRFLHTEQHKHRINAHRHPCLGWESKRSSGWRQFMLDSVATVIGPITLQGIDLRLVRWLVNYYLRYYPGVCHNRWSETKKNHGSPSPGQDLNSGHPEYEARALPTEPWRTVWLHRIKNRRHS